MGANDRSDKPAADPRPPKPLPAAAERALAEAAARRAAAEQEEKDRKANDRPREVGGPPGPEPTRYGDWEKNGQASDF